ncbi:MAG TPA: ABC transporter ATP-binding protein [Thermodesulfobacteriota bacterium]|nr:ABC transporter ATP-binding protein [Thermodesulfobacteriota bacterium]
MLKVDAIDVFYGDLQAVKRVSFDVGKDEIVSLVGSNGAGKTTTMNAVSGIHRIASGSILFGESDIARLASHKIVDLGIIQVPEGRMLFPEMTVMENLEMGCFSLRARKNFRSSLNEVIRLFPILSERKEQLAGTLSGGEQQMLAIGRGLMAQPAVLMLDEPSLGLAPLVVEEIIEVIKNIREQGTSVLLVEQSVYHALSISDRAYILENGEVVMEGKGWELLKDEKVKKAYLGL